MSDLATTATEFQNTYLIDRGLLKPGGRRELETELASLRQRGRVARVLLLRRGESLEPWRTLWNELELDEGRDLLLLFNGQRWEARGWSRSSHEVARALARAEPDLRVYFARGLVTALRRLDEGSEVSVEKTEPEDPQSNESTESNESDEELSLWWPLSGGALALVGGGGLVALALRRRMQREQEGQAAVREALASARDIFARIILGGDELALTHPREAEQLQLEASTLEDELERFERDVREATPGHDYDVTLSRIRQLENQLRVLASTLLQKRSDTHAQEPNHH